MAQQRREGMPKVDALEDMEIPRLIAAGPATSDLVLVDDRVALLPLFRALAQAGFSVINDRKGRLIVTDRPEDFIP